MIDILMVTYNSEKWLEACVESLALSEYDLKQVSLCFLDNCSADGTVKCLEKLKERYAEVFGGIQIERAGKKPGLWLGKQQSCHIGPGRTYLLSECGYDRVSGHALLYRS